MSQISLIVVIFLFLSNQKFGQAKVSNVSDLIFSFFSPEKHLSDGFIFLAFLFISNPFFFTCTGVGAGRTNFRNGSGNTQGNLGNAVGKITSTRTDSFHNSNKYLV